ncbi:MAG: 23S rRNA (adenine(2503)-C(2))-methyltransferase RlmN [Firmicutes bacterium]|nr:23S rRNA (adenine(2503)-C(2))-methyltransferase RlmN [Bacillota bacterium]MDD4693418.1 23S rRNA (adenine(2503)-C(2))-methyltransferase RlmN [Bacillota bacterium]
MDLFSSTKLDLEEHITDLNLPKFRAKQLLDWVYKKGITDTKKMTNLPHSLQESTLGIVILPLKEKLIQRSKDLTQKAVLELSDGELIETVYIPEQNRATVCFSTQVGCAMGCEFCATGKSGFSRNLSAGEIVGQLYYWKHTKKLSVTNAVAMGQGEPLANFENFKKAIDIINDPDCFGLGARHLTVSTCGIVPKIRALKEAPWQINLSVSLHAPTDELRSQIMPINNKFPLKELIEVIEEYIEATNRRVTFEYTVVPGFNDGKENAKFLIELLRGLLCHVNVIAVNPIEGKGENAFSAEQFAKLISRDLNVTLRRSRGSDIDAACGQLKRKVIE